MTGMLQDLLHERADHAGAPLLDLEEITRAGERRVRRRRTALVGGLAAAAAMAAIALPALLTGHGGSTRSDLAGDGTSARPAPLAWVTGSTLHRVGHPDVDLGTTVRAWVQQGETVVFTDTERRVHVWSEGTDTVVGRTIRPEPDTAELVADVSDVAWVDAERGFTRYDLSNGTAAWVPVAPAGGTPRVTALDQGVVYAADGRGVLAWDTSEGVPRVLVRDREQVVLDSEQGVQVQVLGHREARLVVRGRSGGLVVPVDGFANLSPAGADLMVESGDEGMLLDALTGGRELLDTGHDWAMPYQWIDDDTVAVLAFDGVEEPGGPTAAFLQSCDTAADECTAPGVRVPATYGELQLPIGVHFSD